MIGSETELCKRMLLPSQCTTQVWWLLVSSLALVSRTMHSGQRCLLVHTYRKGVQGHRSGVFVNLMHWWVLVGVRRWQSRQQQLLHS